MRAFVLPAGLEATAPPAVRDGVRLLVARPDGVEHSRFARFGGHLRPGDLVVVNTSATLAAAVDAVRDDGRRVTVHVSTELDDGAWVVEVRRRGGGDGVPAATGPVPDTVVGGALALPGGVRLVLEAPHPAAQRRLWRVSGSVDAPLAVYLRRHGRPIRYSYVPQPYPLAEYQTVFGRDPGSAEMPSAGRPFTTELVTDLVTRGIAVAPITLHTGVSSQDAGEPPQPEWFRVPEATARQVALARAHGGRVVAVGTTVTRALESSLDRRGEVRTGSGWTDLVLGPDHPARVVDGLVTGWHAPGASHLALLEAVAGADLVERRTPRRSPTASCGTSSVTAACCCRDDRRPAATSGSGPGPRRGSRGRPARRRSARARGS